MWTLSEVICNTNDGVKVDMIFRSSGSEYLVNHAEQGSTCF